MKAQFKYANKDASVLMVTLFMASLFGLFLFSYMYLVRSQRTMVARSQGWNSALAVAEAGVEEALAQLNPGAPLRPPPFSLNGWNEGAPGVYGPVSRTMPSGSYDVTIVSNRFPVIYSTGYVSVASIPATLKRVVCVTTTNASLFTAAMAAKLNIDFKGNGIETDSFNSMDQNLSTNGYYNPTKVSTNGDVASIMGIVNVANGDVHGAVLLGPTASDSVSKNGLISGGVWKDFNVEFMDVNLPPLAWLPYSPLEVAKNIDGVAYQYVFDGSVDGTSGSYEVSGLGGRIYVGTNINVTLRVTANASPNTIRVAGKGANAGKLTIYMDAPTFALGGSSTVDGGNATNLTYYGTTNNTQISFGGNASFTGTIYAPEADFKLGGGGPDPYDFVGASVTRSVQMNGHYKFHFDENLLQVGPKTGFIANSWREL